jgi:hypothetical protein
MTDLIHEGQCIIRVDGESATVISYLPGGDPAVPEFVACGARQIPVTRIEEKAFEGNSFKTITIPQSLNRLGKSAISGCSSLRSLTIPNRVTQLPSFCMSYFSGLVDLKFQSGSTLQVIGSYAFSGCGSLQQISLPDSVCVIGDSAFSFCTRLYQIELSATSRLRFIKSSAFSHCSSLKTMYIPKTVHELSGSALSGSGVESITVDAANQSFFYSAGFFISVMFGSEQSGGNPIIRSDSRRILLSGLGIACWVYKGERITDPRNTVLGIQWLYFAGKICAS